MTQKDIPNTWPALAVWACTKWGIGILGFALLIPVYYDLRASNERFAKLAEANVSAIQTLANRIDKAHENVGTMSETIRRMEAGITAIQTNREK
jgi:hypothetical protein